jgi:hypothetical protein
MGGYNLRDINTLDALDDQRRAELIAERLKSMRE